MNYIYDILLNFKYPMVDFYEWNQNDNIVNIKKIPFFRISTEQMQLIKNNSFKLNELLDKISYKTEIYGHKKNNYKYSLILTDENEAIAFLFNNKGICKGKSRLLLDEEDEVITLSKTKEVIDLKIELLGQDDINHYLTINEVNQFKYIVKELDKITDIDKLNYLYYDCFKDYVSSPKEKILLVLNNNWDEIGPRIYNFLHATSINKL